MDFGPPIFSTSSGITDDTPHVTRAPKLAAEVHGSSRPPPLPERKLVADEDDAPPSDPWGGPMLGT